MNKEEIKNLIKEVIEKTSLSVTSITVRDEEFQGKDTTTWFEIEINNPHLFLGHGGEALFALNHLVRKIIEGKNPSNESKNSAFLIDVNGFQKKHIENIRAVAHMMAERARYFKSRIEVDPMSAYERRIVHEFLSNETDIKTESEGVGPTRRVIIKYVGSI